MSESEGRFVDVVDVGRGATVVHDGDSKRVVRIETDSKRSEVVLFFGDGTALVRPVFGQVRLGS